MAKAGSPEGFGTHIELPLSEAQCAHIGRIVGLFGHLEYWLDYAIIGLARIPAEAFYSLAEGRMISWKCDYLKMLAKVKLSDPERKIVTDYCSDLAHIIHERNIVVHGVWATLMWRDKASSKAAGHDVYSEKSRAPGAMSGGHPESPVYASQLPSLVNRLDALCGKTLRVIIALGMLSPEVTKVPLKMSVMVGHGFQLRWKVPKESAKRKKTSKIAKPT